LVPHNAVCTRVHEAKAQHSADDGVLWVGGPGRSSGIVVGVRSQQASIRGHS
jgi:hypothetical protein